MTLYTTISTYHTLETRLKSSVGDTTDWGGTPHVAIDLTSDAETPTRGLKRKLPGDLCI